jgi:DNA recombination protein RmuC
MEPVLIGAGVCFFALICFNLYLTLRSGKSANLPSFQNRFDALEKLQELTDRNVRSELASNREEVSRQSTGLRQEVQNSVKNFSESIVRSVAEISKTQEGRINAFSSQLSRAADGFQNNANALREEVSNRLKGFNDSMVDSFSKMGELQKGQLDTFSRELQTLTATNEKKFEALQQTVDKKLAQIHEDNQKKLEEMRQTVDEKLQGTLEKRLGESFNTVSEQLRQVYEGLGEMRKLATGVGDLKKVLTNVKTRGTWGEIAAGNLLDQILSPEQWGGNIVTKPGSGERVDFAVKLPGRSSDDQETVWLPIDAKFPKEAYERLLESSDAGDQAGILESGKELERQVRLCAKSISEKYLNPPHTTDFGIMFLASEGLYAEVIRRTGLVEQIQREFRIVVAGPSTLAALLNSLQMGFRTLAIERRSSEVWKILSAVKTEFGKFGMALESVKKKLDQASKTIDKAEVRTRVINRKLRDVEELPSAEMNPLLESKYSEENSADEYETGIH